jgi:hypothetical protein
MILIYIFVLFIYYIMNKIYFRFLCLCAFICLFTINVSAQNCTVNAGVNQSICPNTPFVLHGTSSGLFASGGNATWSQVSGPAVVLGAPVISGDDIDVPVTGYTAGNTYVFKLSAKCTDGSNVSQTVTYITYNATLATVSPSATVCPGTYAFTGSTPGAGEEGFWDLVQGDSIFLNSFSAPNNSAILPIYATKTTLEWTIYNPTNSCISEAALVLTNPGGVTPVDAGPDQVLSNCYSITQTTRLNASYGGNGAGGQEGTWSYVSGPSIPVFDSTNGGGIHTNNTYVGNLVPGTYVLKWTVTGPCINGQDTMSITVPPPTQSITSAGNDTQTFCDIRTSAVLTGPNPAFTNEKLAWSVVSGPGVLTSPGAATTTVTGLNPDSTSLFHYTITDSVTGCVSTGTYLVL